MVINKKLINYNGIWNNINWRMTIYRTMREDNEEFDYTR